MQGRRPPRNIHDAFARRVFSRVKTVAILLRHILPPRCLEYLDLDTLGPDSPAHVKQRLDSRYSDLLYTVRLRGTHHHIAIYVALDHQSTRDRLMPWRELEYVVGIWESYVQDQPRPPRTLPFILPIVLLQRRARSTPTRLSEIVDLPAEVRAAFGMPIELEILADDLSSLVLDDPESNLQDMAFVRVARALLYAHGNPSAQTDEHIARLRAELRILLDPKCSGDVSTIWAYTENVFGEGSPIYAAVYEVINRREPMDEDILMGKWIKKGLEKGLEKGRAEGIAQGRVRSLLDVLELRALPLTSSARERILSTKDERTLERWFRRALEAASLDEIFLPGEPVAPSMGATT